MIKLHTGGAAGADYYFAKAAMANDVVPIMHSFAGHSIVTNNLDADYFVEIHPQEELYAKEVWHAYEQAAKDLGRMVTRREYIQKLMLRDYFQVKDSEYVFAVAPLQDEHRVNGGTGYAVQMAITKRLPVVIFDDNQSKQWHYYSYNRKRFVPIDHNPPIGFAIEVDKKNITGIGTRNISSAGIKAINLLLTRKE